MNLRFVLAGAAIVFAAAAPAWAGNDAAPSTMPVDVLRALSHCATITDGQQRLACYDAAAPRVQAALAAEPGAAGKRTPTKTEQESWFGFDLGDLFGTSKKDQTTPARFGAENTEAAKQKHKAQSPATAPEEIDSIKAKLTDYAYNAFGKFIVFLDNGQVWKQLQGDSGRASFRRNAADNTVTISRGFLGSYNLSVNDSNRIYKVTRVK